MAKTPQRLTPPRGMTAPDLRGRSARSRQSSCIDLKCLSKRISNFCSTRNIESLKLPATVSGNIILIQRVPYKTFVGLQTLVEQRKLDCIRNWRLEYRSPPIKGRHKPYACGTLRIKMPSARHEILKQFTSRLMNDMWYDEKFVPKELRDGHNIIADAGSPDLRLDSPDGQKCVLQPDACLILPGADFPFLVLEVASSETAAHAVAKAKRYIRYSGGKIGFVVVLSITTRRLTTTSSFPNLSSKSKHADTDELDRPKKLANTACPPVEDILGVDPNTEENNSFQFKLSHTTSSLSELSSSPESPTAVGEGNFCGSQNIVPGRTLHSETVPCVKAWVFKRGRKLVSDSNNKQSFKLAALPVLEDVEVYPNCENLPIDFQIDWCEISDYAHKTPGASFTVDFESIASMVEHGIANDKDSIHQKQLSLSPEFQTTIALSTEPSSLSSRASSEDSSLCSEFIINRSA